LLSFQGKATRERRDGAEGELPVSLLYLMDELGGWYVDGREGQEGAGGRVRWEGVSGRQV